MTGRLVLRDACYFASCTNRVPKPTDKPDKNNTKHSYLLLKNSLSKLLDEASSASSASDNMNEAAINLYSELCQFLINAKTEYTTELQAYQISVEQINSIEQETIEILSPETWKENNPLLSSANNLAEVKKAILDMVDERKRSRDNLEVIKLRVRDHKDERSKQINDLTGEIDTLLRENHNMEESLRPENEKRPVILKLMGSLSSVIPPRSDKDEPVDEADSVAQHLDSILKKVEII